MKKFPSALPEGASLPELTGREGALAESEIEAALVDARLRGREAGLEATRQAFFARAGWIDGVVATLERWGKMTGVDTAKRTASLHGLGGGAARAEADLDGYVQRSSTLMLARAAMIATREELLQRRRAQAERRSREIDDLEAALTRVEVRIAARERLLLAAVRDLEAVAAEHDVAVPLPPLPPRGAARDEGRDSVERPKHNNGHRHSQTETMSTEEALRMDHAARRIARRASGARAAPPVLDLTRAGSGAFSTDGSDRRSHAQLRLAGAELGKGFIEVDAQSRTLLASVLVAPQLGASIDLQGTSSEGPLALIALVRRVLPASDCEVTVVLAPSGWSRGDWDRLERLIGEL